MWSYGTLIFTSQVATEQHWSSVNYCWGESVSYLCSQGRHDVDLVLSALLSCLTGLNRRGIPFVSCWWSITLLSELGSTSSFSTCSRLGRWGRGDGESEKSIFKPIAYTYILKINQLVNLSTQFCILVILCMYMYMTCIYCFIRYLVPFLIHTSTCTLTRVLFLDYVRLIPILGP